MATNEFALQKGTDIEKVWINNKILGILAMIGAPMLFVEAIVHFYVPDANGFSLRGCAFLEFVYIFGWMAGACGMRRLRLTGSGKAAKILFWVQITGLILASLLNVQDILQITVKQSGVFYYITDAAYPFSHLLMLIIGGFMIKAKIWRGFRLAAPFLVGFALPIFFGLSATFGFEKAVLAFPLITTLGFLIIGFSLFRQKSF